GPRRWNRSLAVPATDFSSKSRVRSRARCVVTKGLDRSYLRSVPARAKGAPAQAQRPCRRCEAFMQLLRDSPSAPGLATLPAGASIPLENQRLPCGVRYSRGARHELTVVDP